MSDLAVSMNSVDMVFNPDSPDRVEALRDIDHAAAIAVGGTGTRWDWAVDLVSVGQAVEIGVWKRGVEARQLRVAALRRAVLGAVRQAVAVAVHDERISVRYQHFQSIE